MVGSVPYPCSFPITVLFLWWKSFVHSRCCVGFYLCLHCFYTRRRPKLSHPVSTVEHMQHISKPGSVESSSYIDSFPALTPSISACLVHAAVWLLLPWHRVARARLHTQHLVFSSHRAADNRLKGSDAKHTAFERRTVAWRSGFCSSV